MGKIIAGICILAVVSATAFYFLYWNTPEIKYVRACIEDGDHRVQCECSARAMKTSLSPEEFVTLADIANRNDDQAGEKFMTDLGRFDPDKMRKYLAENASCLSN